MNFKDMLEKMSQLSEATEKTKTGIKHTAEPGGYGRKDDEDDEGKKVKADAPKKGRGRPKKDAGADGETKSYDTKGLSGVFGGKAPKNAKKGTVVKGKAQSHAANKVDDGTDVEESKSKKGLKEYFDSLDKALLEAEQVTIQPAQSNTQVIKQGQKTLGTVTNPQLAAQIKQSIGKGEMSLAGDELGEGDVGKHNNATTGFDALVRKLTPKYGVETAKKIAGAQLKKIKEADMPPNDSLMSPISEAEKPDFIDLDKDGNKKESMKKAAKDKKAVKEGMEHKLKAAHLKGRAHALSKESYNCKYDDMEEARAYHDGYKVGLDECYGMAPIAGMQEEMPAHVSTMAASADPMIDEMDMEEGNAFTGALDRTPTGGKFTVGGKTFTDRSSIEETGVFESWDNQLNSLLEEYQEIQEGMTVSISKGQQGAPDSVSVTAQDQEADQLLSVIKQAGLGLFGGDESPAQQMQHGSDAMTVDSGEPAEVGTGGDDIDVVDDHDGMMALIKKVTSDAGQPNVVAIGGEEEKSDDYENEEGHDHEEACEACGMSESDCGCDHEQVDEVESEDQMTYNVAEESPQQAGAEEEAETSADEETEAEEDKAAAMYDQAEEEQVNEWANDAGQKGTDEAFEADIDFMVNAITAGLNGRKSTGQATVPVIANQVNRTVSHGTTDVNESISDWKALAGIK
jgi:hypothetical protein